MGAPLLDRAYGMRWNARDALGLGPRRPRRRVHDGGSRVRGQFFGRHGLTATRLGSVHDFRISSSAHRSTWLLMVLAPLADTILWANSSVNSRSTEIVLMHTSRTSQPSPDHRPAFDYSKTALDQMSASAHF